MNNILGMIGGLGPLASAYFYELLVEMTDVEKDQDHINMVILNHVTIPDRTAYILDHSKENPYPYLLEDVKKLEKLGAKMIAIPCNTSCYFHDVLQKETIVPINNMIEDTVSYIKRSGTRKVTILATDGTLSSHLYQDMCQKYDIEYEVPSKEIQKDVMHIIYENVKAGKKIEEKVWTRIVKASSSQTFILGCTELSVVKRYLKLSDSFVDPLEVQARKIISFFGKHVKERVE